MKIFLAWCEDLRETEEDAIEIEAPSAEEAATEYAYLLMDNDLLDDVEDLGFHIMVAGIDQPQVKYHITAEPTVTFFA